MSEPVGADEMLDRIEELEAKLEAKEKLMLALAGDKIDLVSELAGVKGTLAKAVKALGRIGSGEFSGQVLTSMPPQDAAAYFARITLAELKRTRG